MRRGDEPFGCCCRRSIVLKPGDGPGKLVLMKGPVSDLTDSRKDFPFRGKDFLDGNEYDVFTAAVTAGEDTLGRPHPIAAVPCLGYNQSNRYFFCPWHPDVYARVQSELNGVFSIKPDTRGRIHACIELACDQAGRVDRTAT